MENLMGGPMHLRRQVSAPRPGRRHPRSRSDASWLTPEMLHTVDVGMILIARDGSLVRWNAAAERVLGISSTELGGRTTMDPAWDIVHLDGRAMTLEEHPVLEVLSTGTAVRDRVIGARRPDGELIWVRLNVEPLVDASGEVSRAFAVFSDVTAQINAERTAAALEQRLRSAIESSAVGTALLDMFGRAVYVNEAYSDILGASRETLTGMALQDLVHPDDRTIRLEDLEALRRGTLRSITNEWRLTAPGASTRIIRTHLSYVDRIAAPTATPASDGASDEPTYLVQLEDVTEQRRLEDALQRSGRTARAALDALEQGVVLTDSASTIHSVNPAAERILGYSLEALTELWRNDEWEFWDEEGRLLDHADCPIRRAARSGEPVVGERVVWRRPTGERIVVRISCFPGDHGIEMPEGVVGIVVAFTDITETHKAGRLLDATLDTAPAGLAVIDVESARVIRCNQAFAQQMGRSIAELVDTDLRTLFDPADRVELSEWASGIAEAGGVAPVREQRIARPDGSEIWVEAELALVDGLDSPVCIAATFDVTERRHLMADLERFSYLFEHANDVITVVDPDGMVLYTSPSSERVLGYPRHSQHPDGILGIIHPDDHDIARAQLAALSNGDRTAGPFPFRVVTAGGEWRHLESVAVNLLGEPSVRGIVLTSRDTTEREQLIEQLAHRAAHDLLTDLPNRMLVDTRLAEALARSARSGRRVGLCYIDLDRFKAVNDTLGHHAGDRVLVEVARRLTGAIRAGDTAGRLGGDEFVVVLDPVDDLDEAMTVAHRIRNALVEPPIVVVDGSPVGASLGIAVNRPGDDDQHGLQLRADKALYRAKADRDSTIEVATSLG